MDMKVSRAYLYIICIFLWCGCTHRPAASENREDRKTITVSVEPLRYLTEQIAGETYHVTTFVPKGSSPETYEPTPEQLVALKNSIIFLSIGDLGFERTWLDRLRQNAPEVTFARVADEIPRLGGHRHTHEKTIHETDGDPHVWTSPACMKKMAQQVCHMLCKMDTAQAGIFRSNLLKVEQEIQAVDDSIRTLLSGTSQKTFLIYHPTLTYFAHDYGLEQLSIEKDGKEPSPRHLAELISLCRNRHVKTIFVQQEFDRKNAMLIAQETGTRITEINPLAYDWKAEMLNIAQTLHEQ